LFGNVFITALSKRLDAIPTLFPNNIQYLGQLRRQIKDTGSDSWRRLNNKIPDKALCFRGRAYGVPAIIIEIGNSQNWERNDGVKNKAIQYEEDSEGTVTGVLYLGLRERSIAMIGSRSVFPNCPRVKYLDGTLSTHAVEVISLTSLTNLANTESLLSLKFAHFGPGGELFQRLRSEEENMGFFFTFKEILQMMESIDKDIPPSPLPIKPISECVNPMAQRFVLQEDANSLESADPWESVEAIQASLFTIPPDSVDDSFDDSFENFIKYPSADEESDGESGDKEGKGKTSTGDQEGKGKTSTGDQEGKGKTSTGDQEGKGKTSTGDQEGKGKTSTGDQEGKGKTSTGDQEGEGKTSIGESVRRSARLANA
jgi:hypothetical protein